MTDPARHALIIEDDMLTGLELQSALSEVGFSSFAFASTAGQALEQARLRRPDLVTADIGLMDGDGLAACRALRREFGHLPIVVVSGQAAEAGEEFAVVHKPFSATDIATACAGLAAG